MAELNARQQGKTDLQERMETQKKEFDAVNELCKRYNALPAIVDDDYPEARHYYEGAVRAVIEAFKQNGRI
jgi:hypothetical protein